MSPPALAVKCDRYDDCQREREALESGLQRQIDEIRREAREDKAAIWNAVNTMIASVARLEGRLAGYLLAATVLGTAVAFIAQKVLGH